MVPAPNISIIIVSFNVRDLLVQCLESINRTKGDLNIEVIVVDNNSSDDSVEVIGKDFPTTILIRNQYNAGFSAANNQGLSIATGEFYFLLNPDTELHANALSILYNQSKLNEYSVIAPQLLNSDGSIQYSCWKTPSLTSMITETVYLHPILGLRKYSNRQYEHDFSPEAASGAALMFNSELYKETGGLDEQLFWSEDTDFCTRARQRAPIGYMSTSKVTHHSGKSSIDRYHIVIPNQILSKVKYIKKHSSRLVYYATLAVSLVFILSRIVMFNLLSPFRLVYRKKASAYMIALRKWIQLLLNGKFSLV
jgi:GT2 family glycosyltransferase